jgi:Zn-dependent protease/CBS domain-containing protein
MGVDFRLHTFFVLLMGVCFAYANLMGGSSWRGFGLWLLLILAVLVREVARSLAATYHGLQVRSVLLLPIGGLMSFRGADSVERAAELQMQLKMAVVGPLANLTFAAICWMTILGMAPGLSILAQPLVTPLHLIRSFVWLNIFLALLNALPAYPLDGGRVLRSGMGRWKGKAQTARAASGLGMALAAVAFIVGLLVQNPWLIMAGFFIFVGAQLEDQGVLYQSVVDTVAMRDVMLTEFALLSPSDTLEDALKKAIHTLQDDFPVTRGNNLVGVVSRQNIVEALRSEGNGYVQGVMQRSFHIARPEDSLGTTISRFAGRGMSLVPVLEGDRVVGIVTLQNLMHSMGVFADSRKAQRRLG